MHWAIPWAHTEMIILSECLVRRFSFIGFSIEQIVALLTGQLVIVIPSLKLFVIVRWTVNKKSLANSRCPRGKWRLLPRGMTTKVHFRNTDGGYISIILFHTNLNHYIPRWSQIPRLISLGWRYYSTLHVKLFTFFFSRMDCKCCRVCSVDFRFKKYASRERKNGSSSV